MIDNFVDQNSFFLELIVFCGAFAFVFKRRTHFPIRAVILLVAGLLISQLLPTGLPFDESAPAFMNIVKASLYPRYLILFAVCLFAVWTSLECSAWEAVFATASAYCMQHIMYKCYDSLDEFLTYLISDENTLRLIHVVSRPVIFCGSCVMFWLFFAKKLKQLNGFRINNKYMVVLAIVIVTVANSLNAIFYALYYSYPSGETKSLFLTVYTLLPLLLCYLCLLGLLDGTYKQTINENYIRSQALYDKMRAQYEQSKQNADTINIKYHDLKRFLERSTYSREALADMSRAVEQYEALPKTGNHALNIVLSEKLVEMKAAGIEFHANINALPLGFMSEIDVYSFFSNLLSNAVEHLMADQNAARYVFLDISQSGEMVKIIQENGLSTPVAVDRSTGLPQTTKSDKLNHGFGVKSMSETVKKYGGNVLFDAKSEKFTVVVLIPIPTR